MDPGREESFFYIMSWKSEGSGSGRNNFFFTLCHRKVKGPGQEETITDLGYRNQNNMDPDPEHCEYPICESVNLRFVLCC
jgi:hypothetical protein